MGFSEIKTARIPSAFLLVKSPTTMERIPQESSISLDSSPTWKPWKTKLLLQQQNSRPKLMEEIGKGADLKHAETVDKSAPVIEEGVTVKESQRPALLAEIKKAAE